MPGSKSADDTYDRDKSRRGERDGKQSSLNNLRDRSPMKSKRVVVSNIPYEYRWQELKDLFRSEVGEVAYVELFTDDNDKSKGCGVIEFESSETVSRAVEKMHRYELKGCKLVVKEDNNNERERHIKLGGRTSGIIGVGGSGGVGVGGGSSGVARWDQNNSASSSSKWGNTYGLSPAFLDSLNITGPLINKIFVANLDYKVDEKKLKEVFRLAGRVVSVDLAIDKDGKSRGFGTVEYEHPVEAVQAISMLHNQMLYDRRVNVRMDKSNERADGPPKLPDGLRGIGMGLGVNGTPLSDVARNLPSLNLANVQPSPNALGTATNPSSALAALVEMVVGNQLGSGGGGSDLGLRSSSLNTSFSPSLGNTSAANAPSSFLNNSSLPFSGSASSSLSVRNYDSLSGLSGGAVGSAPSTYTDYDYKPANLMDRSMTVGGMNRISDTVLVSNLPLSTTWQLLRDKFRDIGDIKYVEMKTKDTGIVRFGTEREAERAISLYDRTRFDGRVIDITLY